MQTAFVFVGLLVLAASSTDLDHVAIQYQASAEFGTPPAADRNALWIFNAAADNGDVNCLRPVGDVDGDGLVDLVMTVYDAGYSFDDLLCISGASQGSPTVLWSVDSQDGLSGGGGYGPECLAASPDMNGDSVPEVLYGTAWGGRTFYSRSGSSGDSLWFLDTYDVPPSGWVYQVAPFIDITGDGTPEALGAVGKDANSVFCVDGASSGPATVVWSFQAPDGFMSVAVLGDVTGDGVPEVVAGNGTNYEDDRVFCIAGAASWPGSRQIWAVSTGGVVRSVAAMPDLNGDGIPEALAGSSNSMVRCLSGADGSALWTRHVGYSVMKVALLEDQTDDSVPEVLVGWWENAILCLDGATGATLWSTPTETTNGGDVWTVAAIGDLDGDCRQDVIAGSFDTKVYAVRGADGGILGTFSTGRRLYFVGPMPDVDGDGLDEILAGTQGLYGSIASGYCLAGAGFAPLRITASIQDGTVVLNWSPHPAAGAYWVYGASDVPHFEPGPAPEFEHRLAVLRPNHHTWATTNGVLDVEENWSFLVMAVTSTGVELMRSRRVAEFDYSTDIP
ncbi:hypothetical protein JXA88_17370 [Candidatus Fermentibacteria bacterium]|nr:hypothetical protein [Candidatus Fermentibacteria bacterium]